MFWEFQHAIPALISWPRGPNTAYWIPPKAVSANSVDTDFPETWCFVFWRATLVVFAWLIIRVCQNFQHKLNNLFAKYFLQQRYFCCLSEKKLKNVRRKAVLMDFVHRSWPLDGHLHFLLLDILLNHYCTTQIKIIQLSKVTKLKYSFGSYWMASPEIKNFQLRAM